MQKIDKLAALKALRKSKQFQVPGTDITLELQEMTTSDLLEVQELWAEAEGKKVTERQALIVVMGCPEFTREDIPDLVLMGKDALSAIAGEIMSLSGVGEVVEEEAKED